MTNFKVPAERIEDIYESLHYSNDNKDPMMILREINERLLEEQREYNTKSATPQGKNNKNANKNNRSA